MSELLKCTAVTARYGPIEVCHGIDLELSPGKVAVLTGPNGAGKTTLLRRITGQVPGGGEIRLGEREIGRMAAHKRAKHGLLCVPESRGLFPELSVRENIDLAALLLPRGERAAAFERAAVRFPVVAERAQTPVGALSGGEQQMVALARMVVLRPAVLLLDEPSQGLAPLIVQEIGVVIRELREAGVAVLLVEQHLGLAAEVADSCVVLIAGEITMRGDGSELLDEDTLADAYLGVSREERVA